MYTKTNGMNNEEALKKAKQYFIDKDIPMDEFQLKLKARDFGYIDNVPQEIKD